MTDFLGLLVSAKAGDSNSVVALLDMYKPLLIHFSVIDGKVDEDLFQELTITALNCIAVFPLAAPGAE